MSNISDRLGLSNEVREIKLGKSFGANGTSGFHTIRYDFKPASVDPQKMASLEIGDGNQVSVTVPHIEGSGTAHTVFRGSKKPYQKECVLIIDKATGEITLEKLSCNLQLKKTRAEGSSKVWSNSNAENNVNTRRSPTQKRSPQQKSIWSSSSHYSPLPKCSPLPKSPNSQPSPPFQPNPSMPCLVPPVSTADTKQSVQPVVENAALPEIGEMSSSGSSKSDSGSSSDSESSDSETETSSKPWPQSTGLLNGNTNSVEKTNSHGPNNVLPSMPKYSQLSEDLKLSESDSDSDE